MRSILSQPLSSKIHEQILLQMYIYFTFVRLKFIMITNYIQESETQMCRLKQTLFLKCRKEVEKNDRKEIEKRRSPD